MQEVVQVKPLGLRDLMVVKNGNGTAWLHLTFQFTYAHLQKMQFVFLCLVRTKLANNNYSKMLSSYAKKMQRIFNAVTALQLAITAGTSNLQL
jgi:hypothetical protein